MKSFVYTIVIALLSLSPAHAAEIPQWESLFNGKDLTGWTDVNTSPETWFVEDGLLKCKGLPIGVMRSNKQYENFVLHIEWRHMEAGGNSGVFAWSEGTVPEGRQLPAGMEVQLAQSAPRQRRQSRTHRLHLRRALRRQRRDRHPRQSPRHP